MKDSTPSLPAWVCKRDGRLVPFEPDKISQALFAVTENLGRPDPFMARELTDGVLHFLALDAESSPLTTARIADRVATVVRELGQPAVAQAFTEFARQRSPLMAEPPARELSSPLPTDEIDPQARAWRTSGACWRDFALREIYSRDIVAAHHQRLLTLGGLTAPLEPAAIVLGPIGPRVLEAIEQGRRLAGGFVALDGPEYGMAATPAAFAREFGAGLRATGLLAILNLNAAAPPPWATDLAEGPLFGSRPPAIDRNQLVNWSAAVCSELWEAGENERVRIDWHLGERDFADPPSPFFARLIRQALDGSNVAFVFDRPKTPLALAEGLDRRHTVLLLTVGLDLPRLLDRLGGPIEPARFLEKLSSLARLAISAGVQKRDFLRRHRPDWPAFLLGQARLAIVPLGLQRLVEQVMKRDATGGSAVDLARPVVAHLVETLEQAGRSYRLKTCVDSLPDGQFDSSQGARPFGSVADDGLNWHEEDAVNRRQLRLSGTLHAAAGEGTATVIWPQEMRIDAEAIREVLHYTWKQTGVVRLRFRRATAGVAQMVAPWDSGR